MTDPLELWLNWIPIHGIARIVWLIVKMISAPICPLAMRPPSMNRPIPGSNRTVVFGRIVRVARAVTVTWFVTT